jgi:hypothetical protein
MTRQATFKRRIRARMAKTGERYNAARRALIEAAPSSPNGTRTWVAAPEMGDDAVRAATGRDWNAWCDLIEASPVAEDDHAAIAAHLVTDHGVDGWWAQSVTVGFERITGRRLPYQQPDGSFTANRSATVTVDVNELRAMLLDAAGRDDLFPGAATELRSKPTAKSVRIGLDVGVAQISLLERADGRAKVTIQHHKLPSYDEVVAWKAWWGEWLAAIDGAGDDT